MAKHSIEFDFEVNELVTVKLTGEKGIVKYLAVEDDNRVTYHVQTGKSPASYWKASELQAEV